MWLAQNFDHSNFRVMAKIEKCGVELMKWSREHFGSMKKELLLKRNMLAKAEIEAMQSGCNECVRQLKLEIDTLMDKENMMWLQRSKTLWATQRDQNPCYFHSRATKWYRKNYIHRLRRLNGQWNSSKEKVTDILVKYYTELYTSATPIYSKETLLSIHTLVSAQMNEKLSGEFKTWEVHAAVKQMAPLKVPGLDGMALLLFFFFSFFHLSFPLYLTHLYLLFILLCFLKISNCLPLSNAHLFFFFFHLSFPLFLTHIYLHVSLSFSLYFMPTSLFFLFLFFFSS